MANNIKLKYVSEELVDNQRIRKTQELVLVSGKVQIGTVGFIVTKISANHISLEIDEEKSPKARFILTKQILGKTITVPMKSMNLSLGNWLDFSDGETNKKHTMYLSGINYIRG
jgi:hypothetical protein